MKKEKKKTLLCYCFKWLYYLNNFWLWLCLTFLAKSLQLYNIVLKILPHNISIWINSLWERSKYFVHVWPLLFLFLGAVNYFFHPFLYMNYIWRKLTCLCIFNFISIFKFLHDRLILCMIFPQVKFPTSPSKIFIKCCENNAYH